MIYEHLSKIKHSSTLHIVIGAFDGVHMAHQQLIQHAIQNAKKQNHQSMIFSFAPLPKEFFSQENFTGNILSHDKRKELLEVLNADYTVIVDFENIKDYSEEQFIEILLSKADHIIIYSGNDFRMGSYQGNTYQGNRLTRITLEDIVINNDICRSSNIRHLIQEGEIERANILLNKEYGIFSHSISGDKIGRSIDFPTINIQPNTQVMPKNGVYFGEIKLFHRIHPVAIYVGKRPTINGLELRIECHVIEEFPHGDIPPNTPVEVYFLKKIAEEKSFKSLAELKEMLYNYKNISLGLATERYK